MCNRLTVKATKFQQSGANRFLAVKKTALVGKFVPPSYKLGLKSRSQPVLAMQRHTKPNHICNTLVI